MDHTNRDEWIRDRAYSLWEGNGREHGRDYEHWQQAQADWLEQQRQDPRRTGARPPTDEERAEILARISGASGEGFLT